MKELKVKEDTYVLCHNNTDVIHCVFLKKGNTLTTGQEFVEKFLTIDNLKKRVNEIVKDDSYFDSNFDYLKLSTEEKV